MLLLDKLKSSTPSRIINVSSFMYAIAAIDFDDLNGEKYYMSYNAYIQSKLANILFTFELSKKLESRSPEFPSDCCFSFLYTLTLMQYMLHILNTHFHR